MKIEGKIKLKPLSKNTKLRYKFFIFGICFFISFAFWVIIKLSKEYSITVNYPVKYVGIPDNRVIINNLDTNLSIKIKSDGFSLFKIKYFYKLHTINISIDKLNRRYYSGKEQFYLLTSSISDEIAKQLSFDAKVVTIKPDTIYFLMEHMAKKKVSIVPKFKLSFNKQYYQYESIRLVPDSTVIYGTKENIDSINSVNLVYQEIDNIEGNINKEIPIDFINNYSQWCDVSTVNVRIPVEKYTETTFQVPVKPINFPFKHHVKLFPENVNLTCLVALRDFKKISNEEFQVIADYTKAQKNDVTKKLKLEVAKFPNKVMITKVEPEKIEYILIK